MFCNDEIKTEEAETIGKNYCLLKIATQAVKKKNCH